MTTPPVTLADLKQYLNIDSTVHDDELPLHLTAATEAVEQRVGPMEPQQRTEVVYAPAGGVVMLGTYPVLSVDSVQTRAGDVSAAIDTSWSNLAIGQVHLCAHGPVRVSYTVGRTPVPDDLKVATLVVGGHLWETQRGNASGGALAGMGEDAGIGAQTSFIRAQGFALPRRAMELMHAHRLVSLP